MHAWLSAYHRPSDARKLFDVFKDDILSRHVDLDVESLSITSGVIWTALNIDYPGHSFSHLGVFRGATHSLAESILLSAMALT
jgi:glycosylphosphatidylinositol transamidase